MTYTAKQRLEDEARRKFTDERYPPALKEWLRLDALPDAYAKNMPREDAVLIIERVWKEVGLP